MSTLPLLALPTMLMVRLAVALVTICQLIRHSHGAVALSPIVQCSDLMDADETVFEACATTYFETPSPTFINNATVYVGPTVYQYSIVEGLEDGVDTMGLSPEELSAATENGIVVTVRYEVIENCTVTVEIKGTTTTCLDCTHCGSDTFIADCTNVPNGRAAMCESTAEGNVYFPLNAAALNLEKSVESSPAPSPSSTSIFPSASGQSAAPVLATTTFITTSAPAITTNTTATAITGKRGKMAKQAMGIRKKRASLGMMRKKAKDGRGGKTKKQMGL
jgi:hypothetical protein